MKKIFAQFALFIATFGFIQAVALAPSVSALDITEKGSVGSETLKNDGGQKIDSTITSTINTLLMVLGIFAVIIIIIAGVRFATSNGDPGAIKSAKNAILYACIGLVVAMLAFVIVNYVISAFSGGTTK